MANDWHSFSLRKLGELKYGKSPKEAVMSDSGYPVVGTSGILGFTEKPLFNGPLIMVGRKGTIDKPLFVEEDCWIIDTAFGLLPDNTAADVKWLFYVLANYSLSKLNEATGVPSLNRENLYNIEVPTPPLPEQRKIAAILTSIDDAITATQRIIDQTEVVKRGLMQQLLKKGIGHSEFKETEIGEIPTEWEVVRLGEVSKKIQDGTHFSPKTVDDGVKYITSRNIRPFRLELSNIQHISQEAHRTIYKRCDVQFGDVLLTKDGVNTGNAVVNSLQEEFSLLSSVCFIRPSDLLNSHFLCQYLNSEFCSKWISEQMTGNAIRRLVLGTINNLPLALPPVEEQREIAKILGSIDRRSLIESDYVSELSKVKQGLMQVLLTGKVRVNTDEPCEVPV